MKYDFNKKKKPLRRRLLFQAITWILPLAAAVVFAYLLVCFGAEKTQMPGKSMEPTLSAGCDIVVNKAVYKWKEPERFDVVVFKQSGNEHSYYNIKRVIGLPGDSVLIADGVIYINGEELKEPVLTEKIRTAGIAEEGIVLDENEYFVLGDNRNYSEDSRFATVGCIVREDIMGKAWITLKPFNFVSKLNRDPAYEKFKQEEHE